MNDNVQNKIQLFEDKRIRMAWDEENEELLFSVVDVVGVLTEQPTHRSASNYWRKLKQRIKAEGGQLVTNCHQLKMKATDGKKYNIDVANSRRNAQAESTTGIATSRQGACKSF